MQSESTVNLKERIEAAMRTFYQGYYKDQLGLVDWEARIENRLDEENWLGEPQVSRVEDWRNMSFAGLKVLVVGAGTGAESVVLHQRGAEVHGIEPGDDAFAILQLKAELHGIPAARFQQAVAEEIPHDDNSFDFVYCYTVLEHVQDVEASIDEMIRVCKVGGTIYIQTPDYRFPYEGHYKSFRLPFSPKWLTYLQFWLEGKPVEFLKSINFVNPPAVAKLLLGQDLLIAQITPPHSKNRLKRSLSVLYSRRDAFIERFGISREQFLFLRKLA